MIELGGYALHRSQGLASITLCSIPISLQSCHDNAAGLGRPLRVTRQWGAVERGEGWGWSHTLDADMDVLLGLDSLSRVLVGFGEGV